MPGCVGRGKAHSTYPPCVWRSHQGRAEATSWLLFSSPSTQSLLLIFCWSFTEKVADCQFSDLPSYPFQICLVRCPLAVTPKNCWEKDYFPPHPYCDNVIVNRVLFLWEEAHLCKGHSLCRCRSAAGGFSLLLAWRWVSAKLSCCSQARTSRWHLRGLSLPLGGPNPFSLKRATGKLISPYKENGFVKDKDLHHFCKGLREFGSQFGSFFQNWI